MKTKKVALILSLAVILVCGIFCGEKMAKTTTYDGTDTDVVALYEDPSSYDVEDPDGVADVIVQENLEKTEANNVVFSVVYNFRGYDTMGESFILIAAIAGSLVILRKSSKKEKEG